jgi:hypothetical protein
MHHSNMQSLIYKLQSVYKTVTGVLFFLNRVPLSSYLWPTQEILKFHHREHRRWLSRSQLRAKLDSELSMVLL